MILPDTRRKKQAALVVVSLVVLGGVLRFLPGWQAGFPINDGGMFLVMIRDLQANRFVLPSVTSYNVSGIPFAYPPFGFYLAAALSDWLSIPPVDLLLWLPPLVSAAIIPTLYWLARQIFKSESKAIVATALYAFLPGASDWLIMGGGLTRAFGILFSLLAIGFVRRVFREGEKRSIIPAILFCACAVLSHPEVGLQTAAICFVLWVFDGRSLSGTKSAALIAAGAMLLTAPWWLTVLRYHGLAPFESAIQTGARETLIASLFHSIFSLQGGLPILPTLCLVGIFAVSRRRDFPLVTWAFVPFFVDPRNAPAIAIFPLIMLASEGAHYLNAEFIRAYSKTFHTRAEETSFPLRLSIAIFTVLLLYLFLVSWGDASNLARVSLTQADRETMEWVRQNTPVESRFLLFTNTGQVSPMADSYQEWFPALAERNSQNTLQGLEWTLGSEFFSYSRRLSALQSCQTADCLAGWMRREDVEADYLVFKKRSVSASLMDSVRANHAYQVVYDSENALIFLATP
ncbi:MAG TPA: 6-pyruvoyl-tetrahydropterin synthase-related protein [Anaerolineales bacterium]|nr:6-pyruvoyl-tetrahydropterin synthase-related protein [Anaerolineales bacterium]